MEPGDIVFLQTGGPALTIASVDEEEVRILWFTPDGNLHSADVPPQVLTTEPGEAETTPE